MNRHTRTFEPEGPPEGLMTDDEFLTFIEERPEHERWQLIDGVPFCMNPATNRHQRLCLRLANLLNDGVEAKRPDLVALTERGLLLPGVKRFRPIADVAVVLDDDGGSYTDSFFLAAEILSPSNTEEHIDAKRQRYIQHPENLCVLVISQDEVRVQVWLRSTGWTMRLATSLRNVVAVPELGVHFDLKALYGGTPLVR
jgi:Uma2 family endonuclease